MTRNIDLMGRKKIWFSISAVIIAVSIASLLTLGLNLSIDFKSGAKLTMSVQQQASVDDMRLAVSDLGYPDAVVQTIGDGRFQITFPELSDEQQGQVIDALNEVFGVNLDDTSWEVVGPTFGQQVRDAAIKAVIIAWLLIVGYVSLRFEFKFAMATIAALIHDLVITVGVYSLTGREVTTATVAAVLTILGYSLYDTIIVFDRVRENQPRARRGTYGEMVNTSIMEVLNRSIITTLTTVLPVACLFIFGGETLKDFAFALMVGIISGTYSSIFLASPLLTLWKEREKRYRPKLAGGKAAGSR
ncbi:MAG: protein translocase subunit SecF [Gaiellales bacterium]|nr:MAG: protein translocase subunit SecF [Gaiellales bacterium]